MLIAVEGGTADIISERLPICVFQDLKQARLNYCNVYIVFGAELLEGVLKKGTF